MLARFFLFLLSAASVCGQVTSGSISGFVFDPSDRLVRGASVTVSNPGRSIRRTAVTDGAGYYKFLDLPPAVYILEATASSFGKSNSGDVTVGVDASVRVDFKLQLVVATESVSVNVQAISSDSAELGATFPQSRIEALPLNKRDFLQLSLLTPGVLPPVQDSELSTRGSVAMHANGAREDANNFLLDGVDNNDYDVHRYVLEPAIDAIQEFKLAVNNYSAEYGRSAGGQVNVITRSGSNSWHGFAYDYLRNRDLDARNFFDGATRPGLTRNQFGGGLGGPLRHNRTFFFLNADALREHDSLTRLGTVPTAQMRGGDLSALPGTIHDPFTFQPFPGNVVPASRIAPLASKFLSLFPAPSNTGVSGNYLAQPVEINSVSQFSARVDHRLSEKNQLALRYSYGSTRIDEPFAEQSTDIPGFGDFVQESGHNAMIQDTHIFNARVVNTALVGFNRALRQVLQQNYQTDVNQTWGVNWLPTGALHLGYPSVTVAGFSQVGDVTQLPIDRAANTYQFTDNLSVVHGSHTLKTGFELRRQQHNGIEDIFSRGSLTFSGALSGSGLADLLLGYPSFGIQSLSNNMQTLRSTATNAYLQDDWKVSRHLTINAGVRYEYNTPSTDPTDRMSVFDAARGQLFNVGTNGITASGYHPDANNFAPRIGFAWSPDSKLVVRGGYGMFYDSSMAVVNTALYFNPPYFTIRIFFPTATSLLTLANPFPKTGGITPAASLSSISPDLTTGYLQHWNLNVQRQVGTGTISIAYAGSKGTHLIRSRDINQPTPGAAPLATRAPYPAFANIFYSESGSNSEFQSLQLSYNRPLARGVSLLAAYAFSKSMDDTTAFLGTFSDKNFPQDSRNFHAEHAVSSFDVPQRATVAVVWRVPGRSVVTRNLEASSIVIAQSGQPFTPILSTDNSNTGNIGGQFGSDRPNLLHDPKLANPGPNEWFDPTAFAVPAPYTFGTAGRNVVRGPGLFTTDLSLLRRFSIRERGSLSAQVEAFNLFNHTNFDLPNLIADQPSTFGRIFSAKAPRQIQFALRFSF